MKFKLITSLFVALIAFVAEPITALSAQNLTTFSFSFIGDPKAFSDYNPSSLSFEVLNKETEILFSFRNSSDSKLVATDIYFADDNIPLMLNYTSPEIVVDDNTLLMHNSISSETGVVPEYKVAENIPDKKVVAFTTDYGIGPGEDLNVSFTLEPKNKNQTYNYNQLIAALEDGSVDIEMRVQTIGGSYIGSLTSYSIASMTAVPEPATMLLLGTGLIGVAGMARRRSRKYS